MITNRLAVVLAVLALGLSCVFLLPKQLFYQPVGVDLALPDFVGEWYGKDLPISGKERQALGTETEFARKSYTNGRGDELQVTIVLAGQDMNTSIHRPERCSIAQGWQVANAHKVPVQVQERGELETSRLQNVRMISREEGAPAKALFNLNYYWFVGYDDNTASHLERTWIDLRDRLFRGYNQRWAYFTVAATITEGLTRFGRSERETDALLRDFIAKLVPETHKATVKLH